MDVDGQDFIRDGITPVGIDAGGGGGGGMIRPDEPKRMRGGEGEDGAHVCPVQSKTGSGRDK